MNSALVERSTVLAPAARASLRGIKPLFSKSMAAPLKAAFPSTRTRGTSLRQKADAARAVYIQIAAEAARDGQLGGVRPAKPFHAQQRAKPGADGAFGKLYHADVFLRQAYRRSNGRRVLLQKPGFVQLLQLHQAGKRVDDAAAADPFRRAPPMTWACSAPSCTRT